MNFPKHVFKAYDIRGLIKTEITDDLAKSIGKAFFLFLQNKDIDFSGKFVVVGRDMRDSSFNLQKALMEGLVECGANVIDVGLVSTPLFNFACANYSEHIGGVMVTASHNPAEYNGFKITMHDGLPVGKGSGMEEISKLAEKNEVNLIKEKGKILQKEVLSDYLTKVFSLSDVKTIKPLKIVVDAGNGMAKATVPYVLEKLGINAEYLYLEPDGNFPNHEANPLKKETLKDLQKKVLEIKADFGFATDGDADRIGLVDELGNVVEASYVGALVGLEVLKKHKEGLMLYDLRSSKIIKEVWEENGAITEMCQVGHANIKKVMKNKGAIFASELSQHLYYHDLFNLESPDLSLLYILTMLSRDKEPLSRIVKKLKKYFHSGEINFKVENKEDLIKKIEDKYKEEAKEVSHLDGLWMSFEWGWLSIRSSNTEPLLRLNLEANTEEMMENKIDELSVFIES